jgi:hypothetical protein
MGGRAFHDKEKPLPSVDEYLSIVHFHDTKGKMLTIWHAEHINCESGVQIPKNQNRNSDVSPRTDRLLQRIVLY